MPSRRKFLSAIPVLGVVAAQPFSAEELAAEAKRTPACEADKISLEYGWKFCLDPDAVKTLISLAGNGTPWQPVSIPHTWQMLGASPDYVGAAWYRTEIHAPVAWQNMCVRVEFEAVFHTAHVYLNGKPVG